MSSAVRTRLRSRTSLVLPIVLFAVMAVVGMQLMSGAGTSPPRSHSQRTALNETTAPKAATIVRPATPVPAPTPAPDPTTTITTTPPTPTPPTPTPAPAAVVAAAPATADPGVTAPGQATSWGCSAALTYLQAYAAQGFTLECPGYAEGREAMTCVNQVGACPNSSVIAIADPCPQAYMNEASNSYVIAGVSDSPIDPYGPCPS